MTVIEGSREGRKEGEGREGWTVLVYLHVAAEIKWHQRAHNDGDGSVVEEVEEGDLSEGATEDEEVGVEVLEVLWEGGRERGREGGRKGGSSNISNKRKRKESMSQNR
jgi:hypothetical protein